MRVNPLLCFSYLLKDLGPIANGFITSDMSIESIEKLWLARSFTKKLLAVSSEADSNALSKFLACNERCSSFRLEPQQLYMDNVFNQAISMIDSCFHSGPEMVPTLSSFSECGLGSGANLGAESYNFYTKLFDSGLSSTSESLYRFYRTLISTNPTWADAEKARSLSYGYDMRAGSRLSFVPKTSEISRTICTEPTLNMFFQRGIGNFLEGLLKRKFNINLSTQPEINKEMARLGSIDGRFGTIDLQSASDCISTGLCESLFPRHFVSWLKRARSPVTTLPDGQIVELKMISSMGNGFTFPLQTFIFASIVTSCYITMGIPVHDGRGKEPRNFAVFGDDIIVTRESFWFVCQALEAAGFLVNGDKSFNSGEFRESCGGDYYRGLDIRGVYLRELKDSSHVYSIINRLTRWSARSGVLLDFSQSYLRSKVRFIPIPYRDGDDEGVKTTHDFLPSHYYSISTRSALYRAYTARSSSFGLPSDPEGPSPYNGFRYNDAGLMVSIVGGFIRDGRISLRSAERRYQLRQRSVPFWNWVPSTDAIQHRGGDWKVFANRYASLMLAS